MFLAADSRNRRSAVLVDIDGVLCDNTERLQKHLENGNWDHWFAEILEDRPNVGWVQLVNMLYHSGHRIVLLTARTEAVREQTKEWMDRHWVPYHDLVMRGQGEEWAGCKQNKLEGLKEQYNIVLAIDDDSHHCAMFEAAGIPTIRAHSDHPVRT